MSVLIGDDKAFVSGMPSRRSLSDVGFLRPTRHGEMVSAPIEEREDAEPDVPMPGPCDFPPPPPPHPHHHVTYVTPSSDGGDTAQGPIDSPADIESSDYKAGWWWLVTRAGTYVGERCEPGDMVFAVSDRDGSYDNGDFAVVQANHDTISAFDIDEMMRN